MRTLFLLLLFISATRSFACVDTFFIEPPELFVDERAEAVVKGLCGSSAVPFNPLVRLEGTTVTIDFSQESVGLTVMTAWGERVRLPALFPGHYFAVVQINGQEVARQPFIVRDRPFRVSPPSGEPGQKVLIEGPGLVPVCPLIHCGVLQVSFGGVPATEIEQLDGQRLRVTVPPGSGRVDVKVQPHFGDAITLAGGFTYGFAEPGFERVLLPLNFSGPGAHGSQWTTDIHLRNDAPVGVEVFPPQVPGPPPTLSIEPLVPPGGRATFETSSRDGGAFLYASRGLERYLAYVSHIRDLSRSTTDLGVEMPLVRAGDTAHTIRLLEVPVESRYRAKLRVYNYDAVNGQRVSVLVSDDTGRLIAAGELTLTGVLVCFDPPCFSDRVAFAVLDLDQIPGLREHELVDVTIASHTRDARIWAFVSVTNNDTQAVTLYTPQHRTRAQE